MQITLHVNENEAHLILKALEELPLKVSFQLHQRIAMQSQAAILNEQNRAAAEQAANADVPADTGSEPKPTDTPEESNGRENKSHNKSAAKKGKR